MGAVFAIMTQAPTAYANVRIAEECARTGINACMLDPDGFDLLVGATGPETFYHGEPLAAPSAFYARTGAWTTPFGLAVVAQMEATSGVSVLNGAEAVSACRDKLRGHQRLTAAGIPVPLTALLRDPSDAPALAARLGGPPLVLKAVAGAKGEGVTLARTAEELEAAVAEAHTLGRTLLLQRFVAESEGCDLRVIVVGGRALGAIVRRAAPGEFRANVHQGATASATALTPDMAALAVRAAEAMGADVAGVDLLLAAEGPLVIEVNSAPGFEAFEQATGIDVAGEIVALAAGGMRGTK